MTTALLNALSGLQTYQRAMETTAHNLANTATPGYSRQRAELTTQVPQRSPVGQIGRGVRVEVIQRIYDDLLIERLRGAEGELGRLTELGKHLEDLEYIFNEPGDSGVTAALNRLFAGLEDLSNSPQSNAIRSAAIQQFDSFTTLVNSLAVQLEEMRLGYNYAIEQEINEINTRIDSIALLNQQIQRELVTGRSPNDLLDSRDRMLREISNRVDINVRHVDNGGILVELGGRLLIGQSTANHLELETVGNAEPRLTFREGGTSADVDGGTIGALIQLANETVPRVQAELDEFALRAMGALNGLHATGNNNSFHAQTHLSEYIIGTDALTVDLDAESQIMGANSVQGIPAPMLPDFTGADGEDVARNLTVNVFDAETGIADKYTVRYEPGSGLDPASRSLRDLVDAINTGVGGGFRVYPPSPGGIDGVVATAAGVDGGYKLQLTAEQGKSIDFSRALDLRPDRQAWTGGTVNVSAPSAIPFLGDDRIEAVVDAYDGAVVPPTLTLSLYTYDPTNGSRRPLNGSLPSNLTLPLDGSTQVLQVENREIPPIPLTFDLELSVPAGGSYTPGERFVFDFDGNGNLLAADGSVGAYAVDKEWTAGSATMSIHW